jgi:hypothetical protein
MKVSGIRDWLLYLEDNRVKAFDLGDHSNAGELRSLCREAGIPVIGVVAFGHEKDATWYGETNLRRD